MNQVSQSQCQFVQSQVTQESVTQLTNKSNISIKLHQTTITNILQKLFLMGTILLAESIQIGFISLH